VVKDQWAKLMKYFQCYVLIVTHLMLLALKIIDSVIDEEIRESRIENVEGNSKNKYYLQPIENWRIAHHVGVMLDNSTHMIRANAFRVNPKSLPSRIYHYHIGIFGYDHDGNLRAHDLAKEKDTALNTEVLKSIIEHNVDWKVDSKNNRIGIAYDGRSSMYSTHFLPMMTEHFVMDVAYPAGSGNVYQVLISMVENGEIETPKTMGKYRLSFLFML
jgi:hypothetical protein